MGDVDDILRAAMAPAKPPVRSVSHADVAASLLLPDGPQAGKPYVPGNDPVHACLIRELDCGWRSVVGVGAVQTGKSLALILVPLLRSAIHLRQAAVYAQPTKDKLHEAWAGKVLPSIDGAGLGSWLPSEGQGSRGGQTPKFIVFRDPANGYRAGMTYLIPGGGNREGAQASVTAPVVLVDECDSFDGAHKIELIGKRADSFGKRAVRIYTSTVKRDGEGDEPDKSIILGMYADSTASRLHFACPHCGEYQPLEWEQVVYDDADEETAAESARYTCAKCAVGWTDAERLKALLTWRLVHAGQSVDPGGVVLGVAPKTSAFGLLWTALDSSLRSLPVLCQDHLRAARAVARGDHGPMRSFWRDQLCRAYRGDLQDEEGAKMAWPTKLRLETLSHRSDLILAVDEHEKDGDSVHLCVRPPWVEFVTVGVDVQRGTVKGAPGRLYFVAIGRGQGRGAILGYGTVVASAPGTHPTEPELHNALERLDGVLSEWECPVVRRGVDVGDRQDELLRWIGPRMSRWWPVKGSRELRATESIDLPGWLYGRRQDKGWLLWMVDVDSVRRVVHGELIGDQGKPGSMQMPPNLVRNDALIKHLCGTAEFMPGKWSQREADRKHHPEWQKRVDYLDALTYARALAYQYEHRPVRRAALKQSEDDDSGGLVARPSPLVAQRVAPRQHGFQRRSSIGEARRWR